MTERNTRAWGRSSSPLLGQSLKSLAITTGRNEALADFYKAMLEHRWDVQSDRRDFRQGLAEDRQKAWLDNVYKASGSTDKPDYTAYKDSVESGTSPATSTDAVNSDLNWIQQARDNLATSALSTTDASVSRDEIVMQSGLGSWAKTLQKNNISTERHAGESDRAYYDRLVKIAAKLREAGQPTDEQVLNPPDPSVHDRAQGMIDTMAEGKVNAGPLSWALNSKYSPAHWAMRGIGNLDQELASTDAVQSIQNSKGVAIVNDGLLKALDILSRPVQGVANFTGAIEDDKNQVGPHFGEGHSKAASAAMFMTPAPLLHATTGENPLLSNPLGVFSAAPWKAAWQGIKGEGPYGSSFADVMRNNAAQDPTVNIFDKKGYQAGMGLVGDLAYDPLNFLGVAPVSKAAKIGKVEHADELRVLSKDIADLRTIRNKQGDLLDEQSVYELLGGSAGKPVTYKHRTDLYKYVQRNVGEMNKQLGAVDTSTWTSKKLSRLESLRVKLNAEREAVISDTGRETFLGDLRYRLGIDEAAGTVPDGAVASLDRMVSDIEIGRAFESDRLYRYRAGMDRPVGQSKGKPKRVAKSAAQPNESISKVRYKVDMNRRKAIGEKPISYEDWMKEHKPFNEALGPSWTKDYRLTDEQRTHIFDTVEEVARREDPEFASLTQKSIFINKQIKEWEKSLASGKLTAEQYKATRGRINAARAEKKIVDSQKDQLLGQVFGTYVDHAIRMGKGEQFFSDTKEAQRLLAMRAQVEDELANTASNVSYTGVQDAAPSDLTQSLDPVAGFLDRHSHLTAVQSQIDQKLNSLSAVIGDGNTRISAVPESYMKDGEIDVSRIENDLTVDPKTGNVVARDINNVFMRDVARYINSQERSHTQRLMDQARRPINESVATETDWRKVEADATKGDAHAKQVLEMFDRYGDREGLFAYVKIGDQKVHLATGPKFEASMEKHVTKLDRAKSEKITKLITEFNKDTQLTKAQAELIRRTLLADGKFVPAYRGGLREFLLKNHKTVKDLFTPGRITFERIFAGEHNLSLAEAMNMRDRALGKVVMRNATKWGRKFPKGLTLQEFSDAATASKNSFREVMIGSPFRIETKEVGGWTSYRAANKSRPEKVVEDEWINGTWKALISSETDTSSLITRSWRATFGHDKAPRTPQEQGARNVARSEVRLTPEQTRKIKDQARNEAWAATGDMLRNNKLTVNAYSDSFNLRGPVGAHMTEEQLYEALKFRIGDEAAQNIRRAKDEFKTSADQKVSVLNDRIKSIEAQKMVELAKLNRAKARAIEAKKVMAKRLQEDAVLRLLDSKLSGTYSALALQLGSEQKVIPGSRFMFEAMDEFSKLPLIKQTRQIWANAFTASSSLPFEMQLARQRALSNTPNIIAMHVKHLKDTLGPFSDNERAASFKGLLTGAPIGDNSVLADAIKSEFDQLMPYFNNKVKFPDGTHLTTDEIMKYMPDEYTMTAAAASRTYDNMREFMDAIEESYRLRNKALVKKGKSRIKKDADAFDDPLKVLWNTRIAIEQAMARKALIHTVNEAFGVPRAFKVGDSWAVGKTPVDQVTRDAVESLSGKGWKTIKELGDTHYFPPESHEDIAKLLKMTDPREITKVGSVIDYATRIWKTTVTIYNPGYYTRNAVGEVMASWFAGLNNPKYYRLARQWVRYARNEGSELAALKSHFPMLEYQPTGSALGSHVAATTRDGRKITYEELNVMYHDQGLKTGFIRTEYDTHFSKAGQAVREHGGNVASKAHNKLRNFGEWYEDYFRMAHFVHEVEHAPRGASMQEIAQHAAQQVRKYHFDYSDFTNFEKTVMLRAFPFYKWTRKALPLMTTMLFQKPGKVLAYPKIMHAMNEATINTADMEDNEGRGFMPVYAGIVPAWMQDMWAYKVAEDENASTIKGGGDYFNLATPQMDIYKQTADPVGSGYQLLNPFLKTLAEQTIGRTDLVGDMGTNLNTDGPQGSEIKKRVRQVAQQTPATNFLSKFFSIRPGEWWADDNPAIEKNSSIPGGYSMDEALLSWLTGAGIYENSSKDQGMELSRRDKEGK